MGWARRASSRATDAKDWHDEALKVIEHTMEAYWRKRQRVAPTQERRLVPQLGDDDSDDSSPKSAFDCLRQSLIVDEEDEGWAPELRRYLKDIPAEVTRETDIVNWWSVCDSACIYLVSFIYHCTGESKALPNIGTHCTWRPACTGLVCTLRAPLF